MNSSILILESLILAFLVSANFSFLNLITTYSGIFDLDDNIPQEVKNDRKNQIIELQHDISLARNESFIGKEIRVLVDQTENNIGVGRTEYDSPEIDNIVQIEGKVSKGQFVNIIVNGANEYELIGKPVD